MTCSFDDFWNIPAQYPCGEFAANANLNFSFDFSEFVANAGTGLTLADMQVLGGTGLTFGPVARTGSVATVNVRKVDPTSGVGTRIEFTVRAILSDAQSDDWSFLLEIVSSN